MILRKAGYTCVLNVVRTSAGEVQAPQQAAAEIGDVDGLGRKFSMIRQEVHRPPNFQIMTAGPGSLARSPGLQQLAPPSLAILAPKIIAAVSGRREHHIRIALRPHLSRELLKSEHAAQRAAANRQMVRHRPFVILLRITGSHWLWVEVFGINEVDVLGRDVNRSGEQMPPGDYVVELGVRI